MLRILIERMGKTQIWLSEETHIHKNRISELVNGKDPKPDEIKLIDEALDQNRRLVHQYCSDTCLAGKYAGYRFSNMDMQTAGIRLIGNLTIMSRLLPEVADMLCENRITPAIMAKLSQLRLSIMALEVNYATADKASSRGIFIKHKRKIACART